MEAMEIDRNLAGAYVNHLSVVNEKNTVIAHEDVRNKDGVLLVAKGTQISAKAAQTLIKHKLRHPIEYSVSLESQVNSKKLFDHIVEFNSKHDDLNTLFNYLNLGSSFQKDIAFLEGYPIIMQKLTVLKERIPHDYEKALFCCWFGYAIAKKINTTETPPLVTAAAGLLHDIGMLHIHPEILNKSGELSPEEWRTIQSHTLIGELFLKEAGNLPSLVPKAVAQHHERCDGGGYPRGLFENKLTVAGQIIALCDSLYAIRFNGKNSHQSLKELVPVIQINKGLRFKEVEEKAITLIKEADLPTPHLSGNLDELIPYLKDMVKLLGRWSEIVPIITQFVPINAESKHLRIARILATHLQTTIEQSGMVNEGIARWIEYVGENKLTNTLDEMYELSVMYREFRWRCRELKRTLILGLKDKLSVNIDINAKKQLIHCATVLSDEHIGGNE